MILKLKQHQNKQSLKKTNNFSSSSISVHRKHIYIRLPLCIDQNDQKKKLGKEILDRSLDNIHNKQ